MIEGLDLMNSSLDETTLQTGNTMLLRVHHEMCKTVAEQMLLAISSNKLFDRENCGVAKDERRLKITPGNIKMATINAGNAMFIVIPNHHRGEGWQ